MFKFPSFQIYNFDVSLTDIVEKSKQHALLSWYFIWHLHLEWKKKYLNSPANKVSYQNTPCQTIYNHIVCQRKWCFVLYNIVFTLCVNVLNLPFPAEQDKRACLMSHPYFVFLEGLADSLEQLSDLLERLPTVWSGCWPFADC